MKTIRTLSLRLFQVAIILGCLFAWLPPAQADVLDKFADFLDALGPANLYKNQGITGQSIRDSKGVFTCLEKSSNDSNDIDIDTGKCIDKYASTPVGQKLSNGIPSWVWDLLEAYIAFREKDFWYFAEKLGLAVMCGVAQFFTEVDVCGLVKDLEETGKALLDAAKAAAEFFKDLGEGAVNVIKSAGCTFTFGKWGCDDSGPPPKPKSQVIYEKIFAPKVLPDGLIAIESEDLWAFDKLSKQLQAQAKAKGYSDGDIFTASEIFNKTVDAQWTADIVKNVLKDLAAERNNFNIAGRINQAADYAWDRYKKKKSSPWASIPLFCNERFVTLGFSHVTRWVNAHLDLAKKASALTNYQWCEKVFWEGNKPKFAPYFKDKYHMESICPGLECSSKSDLQFCQQFMGSVGLNCGLMAVKGPPQTAEETLLTTKGTAPAGKLLPGAEPAMPTQPQPKGLPDITSAAQITIGSTPAQWGTTVNVDAKQAFSAQNGVCQFAVQHTARNIGLAPTGSFDSEWKIGLAPGLTRTWGSIVPGGLDTEKDLVSLKPGMNNLLLTLDSAGKVQEISEANNQFRVRVNVSGSCGPKPGIVPPPGSEKGGGGTQLPAVQQPQAEPKPAQQQRR